MFGLIDRFIQRWSKTEAPRPAEYSPAPGTGIRYAPELIADLKREHGDFFALHREVMAAYAASQFDAIPALLKEFEALLNGHLITERVRLYAYMDAYFSQDPRTREMLRDYRSEMDRIGDSVVKLLRRYRDIDRAAWPHEGFVADFEELGQVLTERMRREETTLYPLYMPIPA